MDSNSIKEILKTVNFPGFNRDIVSFGMVKSVVLSGGKVTIELKVSSSDATVGEKIRVAVISALSGKPGISDVHVDLEMHVVPPPSKQGSVPAQTPGQVIEKKGGLENVKYIIAIASGKGGVGKSTFSVNLAAAFVNILGKQGKKNAVGILDCDIYGPSVPLMLGVNEQPEVDQNEWIIPIEKEGIRVMSMGLLLAEGVPVVWRGPMIKKAIEQFTQTLRWGDLEILVIDLPPGTGDTQLSLAQTVPLNGVVIITTPQKAAVSVALRGASMFEKMNIPILGVAENMSYLLNESSGEKQHIFGQGGGEGTAQFLNTEFFGMVPLDERIRSGADAGVPIVFSEPNSVPANTFVAIASRILHKLS